MPSVHLEGEKVYFIQAEQLRYIKIGSTCNPLERLLQLQISSPDKLMIIGLMDGDRSVEYSLHRRFKSLWVRGEWYSPGKELLVFIESRTVGLMSFYNEVLKDDRLNGYEIKRINKQLAQIEVMNR